MVWGCGGRACDAVLNMACVRDCVDGGGVVSVGRMWIGWASGLLQKGMKAKRYGTWGSQVIPQPSTNRAQPRLTSEF